MRPKEYGYAVEWLIDGKPFSQRYCNLDNAEDAYHRFARHHRSRLVKRTGDKAEVIKEVIENVKA